MGLASRISRRMLKFISVQPRTDMFWMYYQVEIKQVKQFRIVLCMKKRHEDSHVAAAWPLGGRI